MHVVSTEYPALKVNGIMHKCPSTHLSEGDRLHIVCCWCGGVGCGEKLK